MCPKSMSCPSRKIKSSLHTYFFFWYPSSVLSPAKSDHVETCQVQIAYRAAPGKARFEYLYKEPRSESHSRMFYFEIETVLL